MTNMTAGQIVLIAAIKISTRESADGGHHFANLQKVRAAATASGVAHAEFDAALTELWNSGKVVPHRGNPGRFDDKSDLFFYGNAVYTSVSTTM